MDCEHFKARLEVAQADCLKERKVGSVLKCPSLTQNPSLTVILISFQN